MKSINEMTEQEISSVWSELDNRANKTPAEISLFWEVNAVLNTMQSAMDERVAVKADGLNAYNRKPFTFLR